MGRINLKTGLLLALGVVGLGLIATAGYLVWRTGTAAISSARRSGGSSKAADSNAPVIRFVKDPEPAPFFRSRDLSGKLVSLDDLKGKVVVLNFWATWCAPCREEIPEMIQLQKEFAGRFAVVGASLDNDPPDQEAPKKVADFVTHMGMNYPVMLATSALEDAYGGVPALPTSFVIDPQGRVVQKHIGLYPIESYENEIRYLLGMTVDARVETFDDTGQVLLKNAAKATELPGVDFSGLTPEQKKAALRRLNAENCTCGCGLTLAECRINDTSCPVSGGLAQKIVDEVRGGPAHPVPDGAPEAATPQARPIAASPAAGAAGPHT